MAREDDDYDDVEEFDEEDERRRRRRRSRRVDDRSVGHDAGMRMLLPVGRSPWAIIAGYLGLISVLCVPAPFALICGVVAIVNIKNHPEKHGMGRAIFGVVMGTLGTFILLAALVSAVLGHR